MKAMIKTFIGAGRIVHNAQRPAVLRLKQKGVSLIKSKMNYSC